MGLCVLLHVLSRFVSNFHHSQHDLKHKIYTKGATHWVTSKTWIAKHGKQDNINKPKKTEALKDRPTRNTKNKTSTPIRKNRAHPKNWKKENTTAI
jgi:hypothetical protein